MLIYYQKKMGLTRSRRGQKTDCDAVLSQLPLKNNLIHETNEVLNEIHTE